MTNDARVGLVTGVCLVIVIAVVFFPKEAANRDAASKSTVAATSGQKSTGASAGHFIRSTSAQRATTKVPGSNHTVEHGETLQSLAHDYYGDRDKYVEIYRANRKLIPEPEQINPGTVLVIPDLNKLDARDSEDNLGQATR